MDIGTAAELGSVLAQVSTGTDSEGRSVVIIGGVAISSTLVVLAVRAIGIGVSNRERKP